MHSDAAPGWYPIVDEFVCHDVSVSFLWILKRRSNPMTKKRDRESNSFGWTNMATTHPSSDFI
jgi:hypothetical protein